MSKTSDSKKVIMPTLYICSSGVDSGDAEGARAHPEFGGSENRIERDIDNLLLRAPLVGKATYGAVWGSYIGVWICIRFLLV